MQVLRLRTVCMKVLTAGGLGKAFLFGMAETISIISKGYYIRMRPTSVLIMEKPGRSIILPSGKEQRRSSATKKMESPASTDRTTLRYTQRIKESTGMSAQQKIYRDGDMQFPIH